MRFYLLLLLNVHLESGYVYFSLSSPLARRMKTLPCDTLLMTDAQGKGDGDFFPGLYRF